MCPFSASGSSRRPPPSEEPWPTFATPAWPSAWPRPTPDGRSSAGAKYAGKAAKAVGALVLSHPRIYGAVAGNGRDPGALVRTIPDLDDDAFLRWLGRRPSPALVATLHRRLRRFPAARLRARADAGQALAAALPDTLLHPGGANVRSTHWLFPVVVPDPQRLIDGLRAQGFEASQGASQITAVVPEPPCARSIMAGIVFLPAYPEMPASERQRLAWAVRSLV